jgi:glycosyltransferase involved in cell wall biosynthesis
MRIGIDTRLQNETGVGRYIRNLIRYLPLVGKKHEFIFINPHVGWHTVSEQLYMPSIIAKHHLDLVHIPYFNVPFFMPCPFVVTMHDLIINEFPTGRASTHSPLLYSLKRLGYRVITRRAVFASRAVIVPSFSTKKDLLKHYDVPQEKIYVTYEGVDDMNDDGTMPFAASAVDSYFLYVGNVYPHKNIDTLIDSFDMIKGNIFLVLVGRDNYFYSRLKNKTRGNKRIIFTGEVNDRELVWLYKHAKATILPSFYEGFGLPAVEAMHAGSPLVVSDIPVFREICQDAPLYFNPRDSKELYTKMSKLLITKDEHKVDRGKQIASVYKWEKMAKETVKIYENCVSV